MGRMGLHINLHTRTSARVQTRLVLQVLIAIDSLRLLRAGRVLVDKMGSNSNSSNTRNSSSSSSSHREPTRLRCRPLKRLPPAQSQNFLQSILRSTETTSIASPESLLSSFRTFSRKACNVLRRGTKGKTFCTIAAIEKLVDSVCLGL